MSKSWLKQEGGASLDAFVGAYRIKTSQFTTVDELLVAAETLFELPLSGLEIAEAVKQIKGLTKSQRSKRANRNREKVLKVMPSRSKTVSRPKFAAQKEKPPKKGSYQNFPRALSAKDREELIAWLPRVRSLYEEAVTSGYSWAKCYKAEIAMIEHGLMSGKI
ncbi:hypothetical protein [Roseibium alexandrii]|uniref:hypothetical protein n=1 Tax=Roseibium alexandrii TaxID=388408 RepID=UPI00375302D0